MFYLSLGGPKIFQIEFQIFFLLGFLFLASVTFSQQVDFTEFDLENGLHVILHQDNTAPVVITSVMYDVGGKDREEGRTGFAHFFEHLLFEGSENIGSGAIVFTNKRIEGPPRPRPLQVR